MNKDKKTYAYLTEENMRDSLRIELPKGQNIAGYGIGILHLDNVWYPFIPGNVVNAYTYKFPVRYKAVEGLDTPTLHSGSPESFDIILKAAKELEREGVRAISGACGFFGHFQRQLANAMDIPVALSSLVQIPLIRTFLKKGSRIGILTANAAAMSESLLKSCGVDESDDLVITDLRHEKEFSVILEDRGEMDCAEAGREVVRAAVKLVQDNPDIGAILLECSDMPPYASKVQAAVGLPVFDFITLINYLHNAVMQMPYSGWI